MEPILRRKQEALDVQDLCGLLKIHIRVKDRTLFSRFYTRIDQVFLLWGFVTAIIFLTAQSVPISWAIQSIFWSALTIGATCGTVNLTWYWVTVEQLRWVVYAWVGLMLAGVVLTNLGIFAGYWQILLYLCPLWLGLCALGYLGTAWGLRSRAFLMNGLLHLLAIALLPIFPTVQYLIAGLVMSGSLLLLAEVQWDMQSTSSYSSLSEEHQQFNQEQRLLRQLNLQQSDLNL
jgi:hypothetical protein